MVHATYMPEDGYWPASFEVVPPQKLALHGQDVANSLRKAASAVILRFREKNKKTGQSSVFLALFGGFLCHFNLDAREQQAILPRLIRQRSIDCDRKSEQPVKSFSISSLLLEKTRQKKVLSDPRTPLSGHPPGTPQKKPTAGFSLPGGHFLRDTKGQV